ncbi:methyltransferase family protein [Planococcus ruber]|uniref:methyltransferase family protein n=1 Tax=Planococcus ruber TaxID=2027871 RepID=UPI001FEE3B5C|nr:isoprenylcysteine carboxylmethyltransferase family protein [Planococcus ruber]MCJ1907604.1 isoprenylcysteine carboxylmethyltransferase family protein [Planococcus ruber]
MAVAEWMFIGISVIWIGEFIFFRNRGVGEGDPYEKKSFYYILAALGATIAAALLLQEIGTGTEIGRFMRGTGLVLFALGVFLRFWGILHLKSQFTRHVTVREGDEIVSSGPYRMLRHPLYTALLLIGIGMALFCTSLIAAILGGALVIWTLLKRISYEEELLIEKFGPAYAEWMKKRARLVPFIY